jgi:methyl-accepting chemotaxis protein
LKRRLALAVATAAALTSLVGCGALDKALDCVQTADAIATSVDKLQQAVSNASNDPTQLNEALNDISTELGNLKDTTDNADLSKAVDDLTKGVDSVRTAVNNGDTTPDIKPITDAATEIGKVCTPG